MRPEVAINNQDIAAQKRHALITARSVGVKVKEKLVKREDFEYHVSRLHPSIRKDVIAEFERVLNN